jgi:hypothetical protein
MLINRRQYSVLQLACGVQIPFTSLNPKPIKIANITAANRTSGQSTITITNPTEKIVVGQKIAVRQILNPSFAITQIPQSYTGDFIVNRVNSDTSIGYTQNLANDPGPGTISGELFNQPNIAPAENYVIEFTIVTKVPNNAEVNLRPQSYLVNGYDIVSPTVVMDLKSKYSTTAKVLLKMIVRDSRSNNILKTEFQEIVMSDSANKPCEIIYENPIEIEFFKLDQKNNWSYLNEDFLLAKFIPNKNYPNITLDIIKKNNQLLPSRGDKKRLRIIADPIKLQDKSVSVDQIRTAIVNQYQTITNSSAIANLGNKSYDIIVEDKLIKPDDLKDLIVAIVPPQTGTKIKFSEVATAEIYDSDIATIPNISLLKYSYSGVVRDVGELHYNPKIYNNDTILVNIYDLDNPPPSSLGLSGLIKDVVNGPNILNIVSSGI